MQHDRSISPRFLLAMACLLCLATVANAQLPITDTPSIWKEKLQRHIRYLASDSLEGRRTATAGNRAAAEYIARQFASFGLDSLAGDGFSGYRNLFSYPVGLQVGERNRAKLMREIGGRADSVRLAIGQDFNPMGFSDIGRVAGDLVFVGYGLSVSEQGYDDYQGVDADGKIALMMRGSPDAANPHGEFGLHATFARKIITAREHGVVGIIFIDPPIYADSLPPRPTLDRNFLHSGIVAIAARSSLFADLRDAQGRTLAELQALIDSTKKPASFAPKGYAAVLRSDVITVRSMVENVVGVLPGNDPALRNEYVVVGGHFDHLGRGGEGSLYRGHDSAIHYGADDNASGTAGMLMLAEKYAKSRSNARSIIFVGFNGEEEGLLGSAALVANAAFPVDKITSMINMDMIGRLDSNTLIVYGFGTSPSWKGLFDSLNAGDRFTLKRIDDGYGPSDHSSFYRKNIPVVFFFTGLHADYHRPSDTWEKINYDGMVRLLDMAGESLHWLSNRKERLQFTKTETNAVRANTGFRVYVGTVPDYAFEGKGLRLSGVSDGGPAAKAGLQEGDIIVRMGTKEINNIYDYTYALGEFRPKEHVEVEFLRGEEKKTVMVELSSR